MLRIKLSRRAVKFIGGLPAKQKKQITTSILELSKNPHPHDSTQLKGLKLYRRKDVGEYRIIYFVEGDVILIVVLVGKRNDDDVYKQLKRL